MEFVFNDGGRKDAGFKGTTGDCAVRSIAIVTGKLYQDVYDVVNRYGLKERKTKRQPKNSNARTGVYMKTMREMLDDLGFKWTPTMFIGSGCKVHLKKKELPTGRIIVRVSKHFTAVIDGKINDISDCSRNETRCVYGYWKEK